MIKVLVLAMMLAMLGAFCSAQTTQTAATLGNQNIFTQVNQFSAGAIFGPLPFSAFPTESDGQQFYCTNCQETDPCISGGAGAWARGIHGAWSCSRGIGTGYLPTTGGTLSGLLSGTAVTVTGAVTASSFCLGSCISGWPVSALTTTGTSGPATLVSGILNVPQYAGAVSSLTTSGTSGASTLVGGVLNIPQYTGGAVSSLTTSGTSGASTLVGGVLNIPQYTGGAVSSLTTSGTSGASTLVGGVLNIPQYTVYSLPAATSSVLGGVKPDGTSILNASGAISATAASVGADVAGAASAALTSAENYSSNASNLSSGTMPAARLPVPTAATLGGVESITSLAHNWIAYIDTSGVPHQSQPGFGDLSGSPSTTQVPFQALTINGTTGAASLSGGTLNIPQYTGGAVSSLTTNGTSGAATLVSGVLNIPQYPGGSGMVWPSVVGIPYWLTGGAWGGAYNSSTPIPSNYLNAALSSQTSINGLGITASTGALAIANGKTLTASNTLTLQAIDGSTLNLGTGGTLGTAAFVALDTDATLSANSDTRVPSQKAVKTYVSGALPYLPVAGGTVNGNVSIVNPKPLVAPAIRQGVFAASNTGTLSLAINVGDTVVIFQNGGNAGGAPSDSGGNTYVAAGTATSSVGHGSAWICLSATFAATTVTANTGTTASMAGGTFQYVGAVGGTVTSKGGINPYTLTTTAASSVVVTGAQAGVSFGTVSAGTSVLMASSTLGSALAGEGIAVNGPVPSGTLVSTSFTSNASGSAQGYVIELQVVTPSLSVQGVLAASSGLLTGGDYGASPVPSIFGVTDTSVSTTDNSYDFNIAVPPTSYHQALNVSVDGFTQLQVCSIAGASRVGAVLFGNFGPTVSPSAPLNGCPFLATSTISKVTIINNSDARTGLTVVHARVSPVTAGTTMVRLLSSAAQGAGIDFLTTCAGTTAIDGTCTGTTLHTMDDSGNLSIVGNMVTGGNTSIAGTLNITGNGSTTGLVGVGGDYGANITAAGESGTTVTITSTFSPGVSANPNVSVAGVTPVGYNGVWTVTCDHTASCPTGFQYTAVTSGMAAGSLLTNATAAPNGIFAISDTATTPADAAYDLAVNVPPASYHNALNVSVDGFTQFQVCNTSGSSHVGSVLFGNFASAPLGSCSLLSTAPISKVTIVNNSGARTGLTVVHTNTASSGTTTMLRLLSATAAGNGVQFLTTCAGTTAIDGTCTGTFMHSFDDYGNITLQSVATSNSSSGSIVFKGSTSGGAAIGAAASGAATTPWLMPTADPTVGQVLSAAAPTGSPAKVQLSWAQLFATNTPLSGAYTVLTTDFATCKTIPVASGTDTITLLASAPANGQCIRVLNYGSGVVTVSPNGLTMNGVSASLTIPAASASAPNGLLVTSTGTAYDAQTMGSSSGTGTVTSSGYASGTPLAAFSTATNVTPATSANVLALWSGTCSSSTYLNGAGACTAPSGSGTVTSSGYSSGTPLAAFSAATNVTPATSANVIALFSACSGSQYLGADGSCHSASGSGTVTSISAGTGISLSTSPLTTSGTITNSGVLTFNTRAGAVVPASADYSAYYPLLTGANTFVGNQTITGNLTISGTLNVGPSTPTAADAWVTPLSTFACSTATVSSSQAGWCFDTDGTFKTNKAGAGWVTPAGSGTMTSSGYTSGTPLAAFSTATNVTPATFANVVALFTSCSGTQYLGADGNCHSASGSGTVTSVATSSPLSGTVTTSGTISCPTCATAAASGSLTTSGAFAVTLTALAATNATLPSGTTTLPQTVASSGVSPLALATSPIASGACQTVTAGSVNSATATNVLSTDTVQFTPNGSLKAVTGYVPSTSGGLTITPYPTAGFVNFDVCNWTSASVTPGAVSLNWRVVR